MGLRRRSPGGRSPQHSPADPSASRGKYGKQQAHNDNTRMNATLTASSEGANREDFLRHGWDLPCIDSNPASATRNLDYYFNSYSAMGIHEEMLKDRVRTTSYQNAIRWNKKAFKDAIVLDIGSGTGVLSIFAAQAGAKHVYAIEYSDVYDMSVSIIEANGLSDKITVIRDKAEDAELPIPPNSVDIIISEWMGYFLLYESMLDCVLVCRDKWLKPGGMILPDKVKMYISGIEDGQYKEEKFSFWDNVYGIDYSRIKPVVLREPIVDVMAPDKIITDAAEILSLDLRTVKLEDLEFCAPFKITFERNDYIHGFVTWFDCLFDYGLHKPIVLSTSPYSPYTHWKQTIFYTDYKLDPIDVDKDEQLHGIIAVKKGDQNPRTIDVKINFRLGKRIDCTQIYHIK